MIEILACSGLTIQTQKTKRFRNEVELRGTDHFSFFHKSWETRSFSNSPNAKQCNLMTVFVALPFICQLVKTKVCLY